jgi:hypothetical protein
MKASFLSILSLALAGAAVVAGQAQSTDSPARHGALHATKECSQYTGQAGSFCTIVGSNLEAIAAGSKVVYMASASGDALDSDLRLEAGPGDVAFGHVNLSFKTSTGSVIFTGGTGSLQGFQARLAVRFDKKTNLWHWDGMYRFDDDVAATQA